MPPTIFTESVAAFPSGQAFLKELKLQDLGSSTHQTNIWYSSALHRYKIIR